MRKDYVFEKGKGLVFPATICVTDNTVHVNNERINFKLYKKLCEITSKRACAALPV